MRVESWTVSKSGLKSEERVLPAEGTLDVKTLGRHWANLKGQQLSRVGRPRELGGGGGGWGRASWPGSQAPQRSLARAKGSGEPWEASEQGMTWPLCSEERCRAGAAPAPRGGT